MPVKQINRDSIIVQIGAKSATARGQMLVPETKEEPCFVIYTYRINKWDSPHEAESFTPQDKQRVLTRIG
jgi:hypothetical protein